MDTLLTVGRQLDKDIFPRVINGGIVTPSSAAVSQLSWAEKEQFDESSQRQRRSTTRSGSRTTRWQRSTGGDRASDQSTPLVCPVLKAKYESELPDVLSAYPHTQMWKQEEGLWLLAESALLPGAREKAVFLVGIPYARARIVRAWGFRTGPPLAHPVWLGPRHTNFNDGSICAFEPTDGTWIPGDSIISLLDIYSLWAFRHMHLRVHGHWPGRQVAHFPYERFTELGADELCGCGSDRVYKVCCQNDDLSRDIVSDAFDYFICTGKERTPPDAVKSFIRSLKDTPKIEELLPFYKISLKAVHGLEKFVGPGEVYKTIS